MQEFTVKPLDEETWPAFAELVETGGAWGGCWCLGFHGKRSKDATQASEKARKLGKVREGSTRHALVFDGESLLGWCLFGRFDELPEIKHRKAYDAGAGAVPDWRITCFFVHKKNRRRGVATAALKGALAQIARLGGGLVESYPEEVDSARKTSSSFLYNATLAHFEREGFTRQRRLGMHHWVVTKRIEPT